MLKKSILLSSMSFLLVACNGAGGGETANDGALARRGVPVEEQLLDFEENYLEMAQSLEDEAIFRFNPCRDELNFTKTGEHSGIVEISGYTFSTDNMTNITRIDDCTVNMEFYNQWGAQGRDANLVSVGAQLEISTDYTAVFLAQGGYFSFVDANGGSRPEFIMTESTAMAQYSVKEENSLIAYYERLTARVDRGDVKFSTSLATFEIDRNGNSARVQLYNDVAGKINQKVDVLPERDEQLHAPIINDFRLGSINMRQWKGNHGPIGFIVFDRILSAEEKALISCYGLYLAAKQGHVNLWVSLASTVCTL